MADLSHIEISSDEEMPIQVPIVGNQHYTWFPSDDNWLITSSDADALDDRQPLLPTFRKQSL